MMNKVLKTIAFLVLFAFRLDVASGETQCNVIALSLTGGLHGNRQQVTVPMLTLDQVLNSGLEIGTALTGNDISSGNALPVFISFERETKSAWRVKALINESRSEGIPVYYHEVPAQASTTLLFDDQGEPRVPQTLEVLALQEREGITLVVELMELYQDTSEPRIAFELRYDGTAPCLGAVVDVEHRANGGIVNELTAGLEDVPEGFLFDPLTD